ncbi:hypothetical protein KC331_g4011 [Hortaea werneckii]|nr:hypothetical protein KC331_g4011 [Hortaea werneckii]KAI7720089.1 hypothetical protein KC353_g2465 [Hortaea werneckii]
MRLSTTLLANLSLLSGAALAQLTTTTTPGECTSDCTAHPTPMPTMNHTVPYPAGNGTTIHISNCPSAYSTGDMMPTSAPPAPGAETTPVSCDGTCPDTSAGMMPTDSGMPSSDAGPSMGTDGGYSNAGVLFTRDVWLGGGAVGILMGMVWV